MTNIELIIAGVLTVAAIAVMGAYAYESHKLRKAIEEAKASKS